MFALKKGGMRREEGRGNREKKMDAKRETVGIHAWKARAARKNLQPRACVKDRQKGKSKKNVPPNQCSRPTELIPAKGFFVASIFSTRFRWNARVRAREIESLSRIKARLINQVCRDFSRAMNAAQFFIIFNTSAWCAFVLRVHSMRRTMADAIRDIRPCGGDVETLHRYPRAEFRSSFDSQPLRIIMAVPFVTISARHAALVY